MLGDDEEFRIFNAKEPQSSTESCYEGEAQMSLMRREQPYAEHDRFIP